MARFNQQDQRPQRDQYNADTIYVQQSPGPSNRIWWIIGVLAAAVIFVGGYFIVPSFENTPQVPATATPKGPIYTVMNTNQTPPDGVYFRHSMQLNPTQPTPTPMADFGVFMNDQVRVICWVWGDAVYGDQVWYYVYNITHPNVAGRINKGWIDAHYVDDGMTTNHPAPGISQCRSPLPVGG